MTERNIHIRTPEELAAARALDTSVLTGERTILVELLEAVRVRPGKLALKELRDHVEATEATAFGRDEKMAAGALRIVLDIHDNVLAVLVKHGRAV